MDNVITGIIDMAGIQADAHLVLQFNTVDDLPQLREFAADFAAFASHRF